MTALTQKTCYPVISAIIFLSGCATIHEATVLAPVGPPPFEQASDSPEGTLMVYSALEPGGTTDPDGYPHHSGYSIYFDDGKKLKYVENWVHVFRPDPATVDLAPGRYNIVATAIRVGRVKVPVVVEAGKTTAVHLDGSEFPKRRGAASRFVHLPNGFAVGWAVSTNHP